MATEKNSVIEHRAYARVGLLGNPSDVYNGRTISFSLGNFWASVKLQPSDNLMIVPHPAHDLVQFDSLPHLVLFYPSFFFFFFKYPIMFCEIRALIFECGLVNLGIGVSYKLLLLLVHDLRLMDINGIKGSC